MKNILTVISVLCSGGGTSNKVKALINGSKHNHFVYCPLYDRKDDEQLHDDYKWFTNTGVRCTYKCGGRSPFDYVSDIVKLIKENNIEIVHFYFNFESTFAPFIKLRCPKVKLVRSIVGYDAPLSPLRHFALDNTLRFIDNYILISNYIKTLYEGDYPRLKKKKSVIIFNGAVNVKTPSIKYQDRHSLVTTSGLCERKNVEVLIEAMNLVVNKYNKEIVLNVLGDGPSREKLESMVTKYHLENYVNLMGYTKEVAKYLDACSIYVHPATTEGFGIAVTEAMFMGCPCIGANAGALPELIAHEQNGYIVDPYKAEEWAQKIVYLMDNPDVAEKMSKHSIERANRIFPLSAFVSNHDKYYDVL